MQKSAAVASGLNPWAIAVGLAVGPVVGQGFSRFAYALLLPPMHQELHWTYAQAGGLHAANAAGYLVGSTFSAAAARRFGVKQAFLGSLLLTALLILLTGAFSDFSFLAAVRFGTGVASAVAFIVGSALAAELPLEYNSPFFAGPGVGIFLSGLLVPAVLRGEGTGHWRWGWVVLGMVSLAGWFWARKAAEPLAPPGPGHARGLRRQELRTIWPVLANYSLFGAGYAGYMTFVIALLRDGTFPSWVPVAFWLLLGATATYSVFFWRPFLERMNRGRGPASMSFLLFLGSIPVLLHPSLPVVVLSALLFGGAFMCVVTAVLIEARRVLPLEAWTGAMAVLTVGFALGQAAGPVLSGWISDLQGDLRAGMWVSPALLACSAIIALWQKRDGTLQNSRTLP